MGRIMDKEIIIDGVDVSGCEQYRAEIETKMPYGEYEIQKDKCHYSGIEVIQNCKGNKGCIYKQLKRLQHYQAEFEHELMNNYTYDGYISPNGFTPIDVIKHIKSELKRLEKENEQLKKSIDRIMQNKEIKTIDLDIAKENAELKAENERLKEENKELERKYADVLKLAKENADSNEYCLQELEKENEQLKADIESRTMCITCERELQNCNLQAENERLKDELRVAQMNRMTMFEKLDIVNEKDTYKQALQEIREIAEKMYNTNDEDIERDFHIELQTKINEVIGTE